MGAGQGSKEWGTSEGREERWGHKDGLGELGRVSAGDSRDRITGERPQGRTGREQDWERAGHGYSPSFLVKMGKLSVCSAA